MKKHPRRQSLAPVLVSALIITFVSKLGWAGATNDGQAITAYVERALAQWQVPGLAIAVVKDGRVEYLGGVGVRELGKAQRMDADTLFTIASVTKAFAGMAAAVAVDRGQIAWDQPVIRALPEFRLYDPYVTAEASFRDLFAHRVGVFGNYNNGLALSRREMIGLLKSEKPVAPFRSTWIYSNLLYAAAGEAVASAAGMSWDEHIRQTLFQPLGMASSSTSAQALAQAPNRASSHVRGRDGVVRVDPFRPKGWWSMDNHAPAGAINSTARDMARWLEFQLGDGGFRGRRIVSPEAFKETHLIQVLDAESDPLLPGFEPTGYALGWGGGSYGGERVLWHGGLFRGHGSFALLHPARRLGIFVFGNSRESAYGLGAAVTQWILDQHLGRSEHDWASEQYQRREDQRAQRMRQETDLLRRPAQLHPTAAPLESYVGAYEARDGWPRYKVSLQAGVLRIDQEQMAEPLFATLQHWNADAFRPTWNETIIEYEYASLVAFTFGAHGKTRSMLFYKPGSTEPKEYFRSE